MTQNFQMTRPLHVIVATPSGTTGQGGIDRIMGTLKQALIDSDEKTMNVRFLESRGSGNVWLSPFQMLRFCGTMFALKKRGELDVVHINLSQKGSTYRKMVIACAAHLLGVPYVLHLHGAEYQTFWKASGPGSMAIRALFEGAANVVVLGTVWRDFILSRTRDIGDRVTIVPNASAPPTLPHIGGGEGVHILFLGRLGDRKGVPQLCEALGRMQGNPAWRATIAGDGNVDAVRNAISQMELADRVDIPGWVGPQRVAELLSSADILVLPSFAENLPVSVIEGMGSGLAIVTTPVGAVRDIIADEHSGLLVSPGDVEALTKALVRLVDDPDLRRRLGEAARATHRDRLHPAIFADSICKVWRHVAARQRSTSALEVGRITEAESK
ncbi:glycosyltransferase family 4 protein [Devosia ginsengisoli]|nr:glycosyltransferase family 4 protein [Devosia ginsengisoli]